MYDFHTHTFLSDGVLSPIELIHRAYVQGYKVIAITDHIGFGNLEYVVKTLVKDCRAASHRWDILAIPGVEITHVPKDDIDLVAREAKSMGAKLVNVHGETVVEPVEPGTNWAALNSASVDLLAHPGILSSDEARMAGENNIFLEISARKGHSLANGHVTKTAIAHDALMLLNSDAHEPVDLLNPEISCNIAIGAGLTKSEAHDLLEINPIKFLRKLGISLPSSLTKDP